MTGGWQVTPNGSGSTVQIWFVVTPKFAALQPMLLGLMSKDPARSFGELVARMVLDTRGALSAGANPATAGVRYRLADC